MSKLDLARAEISATMAEIERAPLELRRAASAPGDREAYDIVARIERKLRAAGEAA